MEKEHFLEKSHPSGNSDQIIVYEERLLDRIERKTFDMKSALLRISCDVRTLLSSSADTDDIDLSRVGRVFAALSNLHAGVSKPLAPVDELDIDAQIIYSQGLAWHFFVRKEVEMTLVDEGWIKSDVDKDLQLEAFWSNIAQSIETCERLTSARQQAYQVYEKEYCDPIFNFVENPLGLGEFTVVES